MNKLKYLMLLMLAGVMAATTILGASKAQASLSSAGAHVSNNGTVYLVTDGVLRPYTSTAAFLSFGFNQWANVNQASAEDLKLTVGSFIPPRDGTIVCSNNGLDNGTCYLVTYGKKAGFISDEVFLRAGFSFDKTLTGDVSFLESTDMITDGLESHRPGTLIRRDNTFYLVGKFGLMGIPSSATLGSWGYKFDDAVQANKADNLLVERLVIQNRLAGELRPFEPTISAPLELTNKQKFSIPFAQSELPELTEVWLYSFAERTIHGRTNHGGVDFAAPSDTPIYAAADGYAISSTHFALLAKTFDGKTPVGFGLGEFVQIWHPEQGVYTSYSHLSKVDSNIPYFEPKCTDTGACAPEIIYNGTENSVKMGEFVKRGDLIGYVGDSGLSLGYLESPRGIRPNPATNPSWDETHLHFEMYTRDAVKFTKSKRFDPFGIYGRLDQYTDSSYVQPVSLWKQDAAGKPEFAR